MSSAMKRIAVIGAGGFAREVAWLIRDINANEPSYNFQGFTLSDMSKKGIHDSSELLLGDFDWIEKNIGSIDALAIGVGTPVVREKIAIEAQARFPTIEWPPLLHPTANLDRSSCVIEKGIILCAGVIATVNVTFGSFCAVNLACTIAHEACIGAYSVLNPTTNISGGVKLGKSVLVGTGAQILPYLQIGDGSTVGAGAVVTRDVPGGETVFGIPARLLKHN
jgi:sugar O-acyltransferase (sialic acid O-acetyltransferase NeuD family)